MSLLTQAARITASSTALLGASSWSVATTPPSINVPDASRTGMNHQLVYTGPTFRPDDPALSAKEVFTMNGGTSQRFPARVGFGLWSGWIGPKCAGRR